MKEAGEQEGKQEVKQPLIRRRRLRKCRNNSSSLSQRVAGPCEAFIITELHKCQRSFHPLLLRKTSMAHRKRTHGIFDSKIHLAALRYCSNNLTLTENQNLSELIGSEHAAFRSRLRGRDYQRRNTEKFLLNAAAEII